MARRVRNLAFVALLCSAAMNQTVMANMAGWTCGGVWSGCDLNEGGINDCYSCPIDNGLCQGFGGEVEYSECVEDHEGWTQICDCVPVPTE